MNCAPGPPQKKKAPMLTADITIQTSETSFVVLLTMHLSIILVINQLNAQNLVL